MNRPYGGNGNIPKTMYCKKIKLENFRNVEGAEVSFSEGTNILIGQNAQGKTNLLEAIFYASVGKSFRAAHSAEMIRFGADSALIDLDYNDATRDHNLKMRIFKDRQRRAERNGLKIEKMSELVGGFRSVLFCPEHLSLIKDGPALRRNYLDIAISRLYPLYMKTLQRYNYILKQRNALIKDAYTDRAAFDATAEIWSMKLAREAAIISKYRAEFLRRADVCVRDCFSDMTSERERAELRYISSSHAEAEECFDAAALEARYLDLFTSNCEREIAAGATLWGIHKDDIDIRLNSKQARVYASQGQQRSLSLALKIAEGDICAEEFGDYPVLLLDDVLSELDSERRSYLTERLTDKQVIMTCCESSIEGDMKLIRVEGGRYFE